MHKEIFATNRWQAEKSKKNPQVIVKSTSTFVFEENSVFPFEFDRLPATKGDLQRTFTEFGGRTLGNLSKTLPSKFGASKMGFPPLSREEDSPRMKRLANQE